MRFRVECIVLGTGSCFINLTNKHHLDVSYNMSQCTIQSKVRIKLSHENSTKNHRRIMVSVNSYFSYPALVLNDVNQMKLCGAAVPNC